MNTDNTFHNLNLPSPCPETRAQQSPPCSGYSFTQSLHEVPSPRGYCPLIWLSRLQPKDLGRLAPGRAVLRVRKNHPTGRDDPSTHPDTPEPKKTWWILMCTTHAVRQNPPVIQTLRTDSFHYFSCGHHLHNWMGSRFGREKTMANPMVIDNWICNCSQRGSWERHINAHIHTLILPTLSISNSIMASLFALA